SSDARSRDVFDHESLAGRNHKGRVRTGTCLYDTERSLKWVPRRIIRVPDLDWICRRIADGDAALDGRRSLSYDGHGASWGLGDQNTGGRRAGRRSQGAAQAAQNDHERKDD